MQMKEMKLVAYGNTLYVVLQGAPSAVDSVLKMKNYKIHKMNRFDNKALQKVGIEIQIICDAKDVKSISKVPDKVNVLIAAATL